MKPKVLLDARMVGRHAHGIAKYVQLLVRGLGPIHQSDAGYQFAILVSPEGKSLSCWENFETIAIDAPFLNAREWWEIPYALRRLEASLFHSPSFASLPWVPCPWIATVHDLNHLTYGNGVQKLYYNVLLRRFLKRASRVLTVSQTSKLELSQWLGPQVPIEVIYNPIENPMEHNERSADPTKAECQVLARWGVQPRKYFLSLTNPKPHKNNEMILKAYVQLQKESRCLWPFFITLSVGDVPPSAGVISASDLSDDDVRILLRWCGAYLAPSLYEGFGRPPVEALMSGVPVLVSDIPVHREVLEAPGQTGIRFISPASLEAWAHAMKEAMQGGISEPSSEFQKNLNGRYQIEGIANHMDRIYRNVLGLMK